MTDHTTENDYNLTVISGREWGRIVTAESGLDFPEETARVVEQIVHGHVNAALSAAAARIDAAANEYRDDDAGVHYQDAAEMVRSLLIPPGKPSDQ